MWVIYLIISLTLPAFIIQAKEHKKPPKVVTTPNPHNEWPPNLKPKVQVYPDPAYDYGKVNQPAKGKK